MLKRMVVLLMALILVITVGFSGCDTVNGTVGEQTQSGSKGTEVKASETEEKLEFVKLIWNQVGPPPNQEAHEAVMKKVNEYLLEKLNMNIEVNYLGRSSEYAEKMVPILNSGEYFDICFTANYAANYFEYAPKGAFRELNDLLPKYGKDLLEIIDKKFWKANEINGKNYAVPVIKDMAQLAVLNVNVPIAKKYGIDIPRLADINYVSEALEIVSKEIETNPGFAPLLNYPVGGAHGQSPLPYLTISWPFGIYFDSTNPSTAKTEVINILKTPELKELLKTIHEWHNKGYHNRDMLDKSKTTADWYRAGDFFINWYGYFPYYEYTDSQVYGYEFAVVPLGKQIATTQSQTGAMHAISIVSKYPERSLMFLNLLNTDPTLRNLLAYGIEGIHYDLVNGRVSFGSRTAEQQYSPNRVMQGNNTLLLLLDNEPADKWDFFNKFNKEAVESPISGFFPDLTSIEAELAVISNVVQEYETSLWDGVVDPEVYLAEFIRKIDEANAEKVIAEIQSQLDQWLKTR
jgi:putative aldouronate transport system substrate-binding protein